MTAIDGAPDALRELVREVLRDVLPALARQNGRQAFAPGTPPTRDGALPGPRTASSGTSGSQARSPAAPPTPPTSDPPPSPSTGMEGVPGAAGAGLVVGASRAPGSWAYQTTSEPGVTLQPVRLATDEELHEFVLQVVRLADNPKRRRDLLAGRFRFTLAAASLSAAPAGLVPHPDYRPANGRGSVTPAGHGGGDHRIGRGAVTERAVQAAASAGARLVLGPRAVLTPLARDRARALGVPIEKER
jgi:hypothetical protein